MATVPPGTADVEEGISEAELGLAARNHALPLEALRHDITPAGLHYLLIHYDIPDVDPDAFRLELDGARGASAQAVARRSACPRARICSQ